MSKMGNENPSATDHNQHPRLTVAIVNHEIFSYDDIDLLELTIDDATALAGTSGEVLLVETSDEDGETMIESIDGCEVRVLGFSKTDDLAAAYNFGMREARGRWILWLVPGERIAETSRAALQTLIEKEWPTTAYQLLIQAKQGNIIEQVVKTRLVPRDPRIEFVGSINPTADESIAATGIPFQSAEVTITTNIPCDESVRRRRGNLTATFLEPFAEKSATPAVEYWIALGDSCMDRRRYAHAAEAYQRATELAPRESAELLEAYYGLWAACSLDEGLRSTLINVGLAAIEHFPLDAQLQMLMGGELQRQGHLDLAARAFEIAAMYGQLDLRVWHSADIVERAVFCLAMTRRLQGQNEQAEQVLRESFEHIESSRLQRMLLDLLIRDQRLVDAIRLIGSMTDDPVERVNMEETVRGACLAAEEKWEEALRRLQSAYGSGYRDPILMRWLTATLVAKDEMELAEQIAQQWHAIEPDSAEVHVYLEALSDRAAFRAASEKAKSDSDQETEIDEPTKGDTRRRLDGADAAIDHPPVAPPITPPIVTSESSTIGTDYGTLESVD